jgi:SsrA-binding protein
MAKSTKKQIAPEGAKVVATNRQARRDYEILDTLEVGIVLKGSEVKSLRESKVQLAESWAQVYRGELWLHGLHISPYSHSAAAFTHEPDRQRKLLAHRDEIVRLGSRVDRENLALIPLTLYFLNGRAKIELAVARGRSRADRRQEIARRDADLEARRAMAAARRRL